MGDRYSLAILLGVSCVLLKLDVLSLASGASRLFSGNLKSEQLARVPGDDGAVEDVAARQEGKGAQRVHDDGQGRWDDALCAQAGVAEAVDKAAVGEQVVDQYVHAKHQTTGATYGEIVRIVQESGPFEVHRANALPRLTRQARDEDGGSEG